MKNKLKPCPFCGCKKIHLAKDTVNPWSHGHGYDVWCSNSNCSAKLYAYGKRAAYLAWNNRNGSNDKEE